MYVIYARNVHQALPMMLQHLSHYGMREKSRYGDVIVAPTPVTTVYNKPWERVMFWEQRNINPFFHLFEALWMLAGRNDVGWLAYYNRRMAEFSDDGEVFHGAYGHRWRQHFMMDQLDSVVELLTAKPKSRRAVIQMYDCRVDSRKDEAVKDIPCNTIIFLRIENGKLDLTVCCRSNDVIWGAAGTNAVHFAILQEYLAARLDVKQGRLYQISHNFHAYEEIFQKSRPIIQGYGATKYEPYEKGQYEPVPIVQNAERFDHELGLFMAGQPIPNAFWDNPFFPEVAVPMQRAFQIWREGNDLSRFVEIEAILADAVKNCTICKSPDWLMSAQEWMERKEDVARKAHDDGVSYE